MSSTACTFAGSDIATSSARSPTIAIGSASWRLATWLVTRFAAAMSTLKTREVDVVEAVALGERDGDALGADRAALEQHAIGGRAGRRRRPRSPRAPARASTGRARRSPRSASAAAPPRAARRAHAVGADEARSPARRAARPAAGTPTQPSRSPSAARAHRFKRCNAPGPALEAERALRDEDREAVDGRRRRRSRAALSKRGGSGRVDEVDNLLIATKQHRNPAPSVLSASSRARTFVHAHGRGVHEQIGGPRARRSRSTPRSSASASRALRRAVPDGDRARRPRAAPRPPRARCRRRRARCALRPARSSADRRDQARARRCCRPRSCRRARNVSVLAAPIARAAAVARVGERERGVLVRDRDVGADEAGRRQRPHGLLEQLGRQRQQLVAPAAQAERRERGARASPASGCERPASRGRRGGPGALGGRSRALRRRAARRCVARAAL